MTTVDSTTAGAKGLTVALENDSLNTEMIAFAVKVIGEGAANVVVEVTLADGSNAYPGRLLRVPKAGTVAYPYSQLQSYWETCINPLFPPGDLVQQSIMNLGGTTLAKSVNRILRRNDASRRQDFKGSLVSEQNQAMEVDDMRKQQDDDVFLEFKPKWLSQSPSAPTKPTRCRNCAREACKAHKQGVTEIRSRLCPLQLISDTDEGTNGAAEHLLPNHPSQRERLVEWLRGDNVLKRLRDLQIKLDGVGPLEASRDDGDFHLAMTLRDCTCFVRIPADKNKPVEAKLGDLDQKNAEGKMEYWAEMERELVESGFYDGTERPRVLVSCGLAGSQV